MRSKKQSEFYKNTIKNLKHGEAKCTVDFSQNYQCRVQSEAQAAYFSSKQVTIHPFVINYNKDGKMFEKTVIAIAESLVHNFAAFYQFQERIEWNTSKRIGFCQKDLLFLR